MKSGVLALLLPCASAAPTATKAIVGYWGSGGDTPKLEQIPEALHRGYNVISLAFGDSLMPDGSFRIKTNIGEPGDAPSKTNISTAANVSKDSFQYLLSFGGQNAGGPYITDADAYVTNFHKHYNEARDQYEFDGVDIDIEGGISNPLLKAYRKLFPILHNEGQIVSMAPAPLFIDPEEQSTFQLGAYNSYTPLVDTTMIDYVDYVCIQLYCNGMPLGDVEKYLASWQKGHKIDWKEPTGELIQSLEINIPSHKVIYGMPSGAVVDAASQAWERDGETIRAKYTASPALMATGGVMTWSVGWDAAGGWKWINGVSKIWGTGPPPPAPAPAPTPPTPPTPPPAPTPAPTPPAPTPPAPTPSACPGGSLTACIGLCPVDAQYAACVQKCVADCPTTKQMLDAIGRTALLV